MTMGKNCAPRMPAIPAAAVVAIMLAGCSSGHIGEDWQCPLATGGSCAGVAAADPAVPKAGVVRTMATGEPIRLLPRDMEAERADLPAMESPSCEAECGFDPFGWLARLFGGSDDVNGERLSATPSASDVAAKPVPDRSDSGSGPLPADPASGHDAAQADGLRTGEVVARIWIAPFVDTDGVYREASHVRVVLEPAGWRFP